MNDAALDFKHSATRERLKRGATAFSATLNVQRSLASPENGQPSAQHIANRLLHEGSQGDAMHKLLYVRAGYLDIEGCFGGWIVLPGHMILIPAERAFNIKSMTATRIDVVHLDPAATPWHHHGCWVSRATPLAREMIGHAVALSREQEQDQDSSAQHKQKFTTYLAALSLLCGDWFHNHRVLFLPTAQSEMTARLLTYLRDHIADASVEDACHVIAVPQRSLHRHCMQEFGFNLRTLIREIRIICAMELLSTSDFSIGTISQKVGFSSLSAFTSAFSHRLGMTPRDYAAEARNPPAA